MTTRAPREEITLPRQVVLDLVKQVSKRRPKTDNPALNDAILTIADVGAKQGYRAARWLVDARAIWLLAHVTDVRALYEPGEKLDVALIVQNGVREALERDAPTTCRAMRKLVELGEITLDQLTTIEPGHTGAHTTKGTP